MAGIDEVFTKSNLDENKKKSKMLFGRLLINLRKGNHIKLYSLLESVNDTDMKEDKIILILSDKVAFEMINNKSDIDAINLILSSIQEGLQVELVCNGKEPFDKFKFEKFLKEEFGNCLTIK